jgi:hypothetical protein
MCAQEFTLTDEQVENWRKILITLPLPPLNLSLGAYALIMPREQVVKVAQNINKLIARQVDNEIRIQTRMKEHNERKSANLIRTRPRNPDKPVRW